MSLLRKLWSNLRTARNEEDEIPPSRDGGDGGDVRSARALLNAGRFEEARQAYSGILAVSPGHVAALNGHAVACNSLNDFAAAEASLRKALIRSPDDAQTQANLGITLLRMQRLDEAAQAAQAALAADPACAEAHFTLGEVLQRQGAFESADGHFAACFRHDQATYGICGAVRFSAEFFRNLERAEDNVPAYPLAAPATPPHHVVAVACDGVYFERYGGSFINAYAQHAARDSLLHVHFISDDANLPHRLQELSARLRLPAVQCSIEPLPSTLAQTALPAYYASARMLHMSDWLDRYRCPVACFDIDAVLHASAGVLVQAMQSADVGLVMRHSPFSPWATVLAGTLAARPTTGAKRYFLLVAAYLRHFLRSSEPNWQLDQVALHCVLSHLRQSGEAPSVARLEDMAEQVVWQLSAQTGGKLNDALYARYRMPA